MKIKEAREKNLCPKCGWDEGFPQGSFACGAERGVRCGTCEELKRLYPEYEYSEVLPWDHICDDCAGIGTFEAYVEYSGRY